MVDGQPIKLLPVLENSEVHVVPPLPYTSSWRSAQGQPYLFRLTNCEQGDKMEKGGKYFYVLN
jgi:hypothetical protein